MRRIEMTLAAGMLVAMVTGPAAATAGGGGGGGGGCQEPVTDTETTTVTMEGGCFGPTVARVDAGDTVRFVNDGQVPHTVTGANLTWGSVENIAVGETVEHTFDDPGIQPYVCTLHPGMVGAVVVGDATGPGTPADDPGGDPTGSPSPGLVAIGMVAGAGGLAGLGALAIRRRR